MEFASASCLSYGLLNGSLGNTKNVQGGGASFDPTGHHEALNQASDKCIAVAGVSASASVARERATWFVLSVGAGRERAVARRLARVADASAQQAVWVPARDLPRRSGGVWTEVREALFPGYVLVRSRGCKALECALEHVGIQAVPLPLDVQAVCLLQALAGNDGCAGISTGDIVDGQLVVRRGPLRGHEDLVVKIDRHKRLAYLRAGLFGGLEGTLGAEAPQRQRALGLMLGLEVISRS